jgi:PleD family two-component response regulator
LLEKMGANAARLMANRLAMQITDEPCQFEGQEIKLGASFGVAVIQTDDSAEALLGRADAAMYNAKRLG